MVAVGAVLLAVGWWAASVTLEPPENPLTDAEPILYTVREGSVGRSLRLTAVAEWEFEDLARNASSGVVTSVVVDPGAAVSSGDVLYTVDLRPVVAAKGVVPAFRDMSLRTEGEDVIQLQAFLSGLGFYEGEVDGVFGSGLRSAVKEWQESMGIPSDGVVRLGDVVFVPELPARMVGSGELKVGAPMSGGELVLRRVMDRVQFRIPLAQEQRNLVPLSADVLVSNDDEEWEARISEAVEDETTGVLSLVLESPDGGSVCSPQCQEVPLNGQTDYPAELQIVPETTGPVIPIAAVETLADGSTVVAGADGSQIPVAILATSDGLAVVEGLRPGAVIVLPVEDDRS